MRSTQQPPIGISLAADVEHLADRPTPYRARLRWTDPVTGKRRSLSESHATADAAALWISEMRKAAASGLDPSAANRTLAEYGALNMSLALRGLEDKPQTHTGPDGNCV